jgi:hypothetical protein
VSLAQLVIVEVMTWSKFDSTGTKFGVDVIVCYDLEKSADMLVLKIHDLQLFSCRFEDL